MLTPPPPKAGVGGGGRGYISRIPQFHTVRSTHVRTFADVCIGGSPEERHHAVQALVVSHTAEGFVGNRDMDNPPPPPREPPPPPESDERHYSPAPTGLTEAACTNKLGPSGTCNTGQIMGVANDIQSSWRIISHGCCPNVLGAKVQCPSSRVLQSLACTCIPQCLLVLCPYSLPLSLPLSLSLSLSLPHPVPPLVSDTVSNDEDEAGEERTGLYFLHPTLSLDPLSAWAPPPNLGQEGETCLPRHPAIRQHPFLKEEGWSKVEKQNLHAVLSVAPCV